MYNDLKLHHSNKYSQEENFFDHGSAIQNSPRDSIMVILNRGARNANKRKHPDVAFPLPLNKLEPDTPSTVASIGSFDNWKSSLRSDSFLSERSSRKSVTFCDLDNETFSIPCREEAEGTALDYRCDENLEIEVDALLDSDRLETNGDQGDQWNNFEFYSTGFVVFFAAMLVRFSFDFLSASTSATDFALNETHLFYLFDAFLAYGVGVTVGHKKTSKFTYRFEF